MVGKNILVQFCLSSFLCLFVTYLGTNMILSRTLRPQIYRAANLCRTGFHTTSLGLQQQQYRQQDEEQSGGAYKALLVAPPALCAAAALGESANSYYYIQRHVYRRLKSSWTRLY